MKATLTAVRAIQAAFQPFRANSSTTNVVMDPKPTLQSARPRPGSQTAPSTVAMAGSACGEAGTGLRGATSNRVRSGIRVVASAIAAKPLEAYSALPAGAPAA